MPQDEFSWSDPLISRAPEQSEYIYYLSTTSQFVAVAIYLCFHNKDVMNLIDPLLAELNELCNKLDSIADTTMSRKRIREIFTEFVKQVA
jgi:hypothetical protein